MSGDIRIQHLKDGTFRLTVNGTPYQMPQKGCDLVLSPAQTKYVSRLEHNYQQFQSREEIKIGDDPDYPDQ